MGKRRFESFSLRNFPLHVDQMEDKNLDTILYAQMMAETLAQLYWGAHTDANDIEFVLAPPPFQPLLPAVESNRARYNRHVREKADPPHHGMVTMDNAFLGEHAMWILDFDCCNDMEMNEAGVKEAVAAFYRNDPYFPRPGREDERDQKLWTVFRESFLEVSREILGLGGWAWKLVERWVESVEEEGERRRGRGRIWHVTGVCDKADYAKKC